MLNELGQSESRNEPLRSLVFTFLFVAVVGIMINNVIYAASFLIHHTLFTTFSISILFSNIQTFINYAFIILFFAAGLILLVRHRSFKASRNVLLIMGSILLMLSFLQLLFSNFSAFIPIFNGQGISQIEFVEFELFFSVLNLLVFNISLFLIGFSFFRGYKLALMVGGLVMGALGTGLSIYMNYITNFYNPLNSHPFLYSWIASNVVIYTGLIQVLGILSSICFIIAFALSIKISIGSNSAYNTAAR